MESLRVSLGKRVRALRERKGWSQERLGQAAGLGAKYIGTIERGEKSPSFEAIEKLARAFRVEAYEMFIPISRSTDVVQSHVRTLLADQGRIDASHVEDFLRTLSIALRKLER